ncbi:MAG: prolyl-tRNA synthetase associated domain-containing protein [Bacteroidetes bacterium]|nr:MAG: prolyl-tRNA synthetase associated domain-containing protein [Bacteroidota bacterium]
MNGDPTLYQVLDELGIKYEYHEHPPGRTVEEALKYWKDIDSAHCKNIFFRNHKGNRHYLVISDHRYQLDIRDLEQRLKQGKLTFASPQRLMKHLGLEGGSVSLFGLINDAEDHVYLFIDENLLKAERVSFHPNINTASLVISVEDMKRFLEWSGNSYEFISLYD